jgi:hypothetical protein
LGLSSLAINSPSSGRRKSPSLSTHPSIDL